MSVELSKAYEVRVFGSYGSYVYGYRPIGIYAQLSVAGVRRLEARYAGTDKSLYTFLNGERVNV